MSVRFPGDIRPGLVRSADVPVSVVRTAAQAALKTETLARVRTIIDVPVPPERRMTLRSVLSSVGKTLVGAPTPPDLATRARAIIGDAQKLGGEIPEHLPALTALAVIEEARVNGSLGVQATLAGSAGIVAVTKLRAEAIEELRALVVRRPDLVFASQERSAFPTFLGLARFENTPLMRKLADLAFPINRVARGPAEVVVRGSMADVANFNVYYSAPSGQAMIVAGTQPRPNVAASALSMLDVLGDSIGESIETKEQKLGSLLTENLIPELGIVVVGNAAIDAAKRSFVAKIAANPAGAELEFSERERDLANGGFGLTAHELTRISDAVDTLARRSGGVIAVGLDVPSHAFVGHVQLDDLLGAINGVLGDGRAELPGGAIAANAAHEVMERGREILAMPLTQHMDICYDLRALVSDFYRAWATKEPLGPRTFSSEQICRLPRSLEQLASEYYGPWAGKAGVSVDAPVSYSLPDGTKQITNNVIHVDRAGEEPLVIAANVANLGNWQFDLPFTKHAGKVYIGLTPTLFNGEQARFLDVMKDKVALADEQPMVHMAAPFTALGADPYAFTRPRKRYTVQDVVRFRGRDVADLGLPNGYSLDQLVDALTTKHAKNADAPHDLAAYSASMRSLHDPAGYGVLTFREVDNPALTSAMERSSYQASGTMQLGTRASSVGEDSGLMSFRASYYESRTGQLESVDGLEMRELGDVLADMNANPARYDQSTQVMAMMLATLLPSPDNATTYWNHAVSASGHQ